ncbi:MAG TPA: sulfite exporter TauE/SafE family protein [Nitrospirales bacterium]|nr:sulfite exporter TauE/SafE family protein [Nitrospirales bacterium]HIB55129.1 sulfite exporter TauE/SafE family protein [Nitrospirales bacterium]HIC04848.1 sulfite exporter TauE/SafE family protein [Nitrospirales bacterium]HIN32851.1 sulfite exporter TauE/SafE family protein [Nitrospirales bacterium]HIO21612.1 sulfite exporter TauE/SafE family protein [Nitrospirales bacterium]
MEFLVVDRPGLHPGRRHPAFPLDIHAHGEDEQHFISHRQHVMINPELWFLFPLGIGLAILAISSGINGSNFWIPVYVIWLGFDAKTAFWLALLTMIFGFGSGVWKNARANLIQWFLVRQYLKVCIPLCVLGGIVSTQVSHTQVLTAFGVFITAFGFYRILQQFRPGGTPVEQHDRVY